MGFSCDPIIECQLNPGTTFKAPFQVRWRSGRLSGGLIKRLFVNFPGNV